MTKLKKKSITGDRIVTILAIGISLFTLLVFTKQTQIIAKQSRLSVLPYLYVETGYDTKANTISFTINNHGVGPAILEKIEIDYLGKTYEMDFEDFMKLSFFKNDSVRILASTSLNKGMPFPSKSERLVVQFGGSETEYNEAREFLGKLEKNSFSFKIYYKSIYEDKFMISMESDVPVEL
ncbi:hypothetical protein [Spongiimicrobium salis]|uniref:hypothetical protein n=1 Tax=Spongiimicrobium salis TaxID=1667022 RepID=UPI00374D76B2